MARLEMTGPRVFHPFVLGLYPPLALYPDIDHVYDFYEITDRLK